jgi:hypothetical protein
MHNQLSRFFMGICSENDHVSLIWRKNSQTSDLEGHSSDTCTGPSEELEVLINMAFKSLKKNMGKHYHHDSDVRDVIYSIQQEINIWFLKSAMFFGSTGIWTKGSMLWKQVFYSLNHTSCSGYFGDRVLLFPAVTGMTGVYHHTQLFLLRWDLTNFFFFLAWVGLELWSSCPQPLK